MSVAVSNVVHMVVTSLILTPTSSNEAASGLRSFNCDLNLWLKSWRPS